MDEVQQVFTEDDYEGPEIEPMSWQASEFVHHQKQTMWYLALVGIVLALIGIAVVTHQWFSIAVFIAMTAALFTYANKPPRTLSYELNEQGIQIDNKFYHYGQFRSFSVISDVGWHSVELDPVQRFMPRLTILFDTKDFEKIIQLLSLELPRVDRHPDLIEQITRKLKF